MERNIMGMLPMLMAAIYPLIMVLMGVCFAFLAVYLTEEMRANRTGEREENLGAKVLGGLLFCVAAQFAVFGLAIVFASFSLDSFVGGYVRKAGMGFLFGGAAAAVFPLLILKHVGALKTGAGKFDFSDRITNKSRGICAVSSGLMTTVVLVLLVFTMVMGGDLGTPFLLTAGYGVAFYLFAMPWLSFGKGGGAAAPPQTGTPGPPPPSAGGPPPRAGGPPPPAG